MCGAHKCTVYPKKYAHGFVVLCFVVVMQSFIMNSHEVFIHIHQGCFAGTGAIVRLPQCQWSKPDGYGKISQRITTTKHSKVKTVCIFLGIYCSKLPQMYQLFPLDTFMVSYNTDVLLISCSMNWLFLYDAQWICLSIFTVDGDNNVTSALRTPLITLIFISKLEFWIWIISSISD